MTQVATGAKMKPAKASEKQRTNVPSLQTTSNSNEEYLDGHVAAVEDFSEELQNETLRCEKAAAEAIRLAQFDDKLSKLNAGLEEWTRRLCASVVRYYNTCFKIALNHRNDLGGEKPADFADRYSGRLLSNFLNVRALDEEEIDSNGRVREFIRHACENPPNGAPGPAPVNGFQLPYWATRRSLGSRIGVSNSEYVDGFILKAEAKVTEGLRKALSRACRTAVIETAQTPARQSTVQVHRDWSRTATARNRLAENPLDRQKEAFIFAALRIGKRGPAYCDFLGRNSVRVPFAWIKDNCPGDYPKAYLISKWRRRIVQEKNRYTRKLRALERESPREVDKLIERHVR